MREEHGANRCQWLSKTALEGLCSELTIPVGQRIRIAHQPLWFLKTFPEHIAFTSLEAPSLPPALSSSYLFRIKFDDHLLLNREVHVFAFRRRDHLGLQIFTIQRQP